MKEYRYFAISPAGKEYRFSFPAMCPQCGRPANATKRVNLSERLPGSRRYLSFDVPYCAEHLQLIGTYTWIKNGLYLLSYLVTFLVLLLVVSFRNALELQTILELGGLAALLWAVVIFWPFRWLLLGPLLRIVDTEHAFDLDLNTPGFTARLEMMQAVFGFADARVAQQFADANAGITSVVPLEESLLLSKLPAFVRQRRNQ